MRLDGFNGDDMRSLVYISTATQTFDQPALDALAADAKVFNAANGVTGFMVFNGLNFMQLIEGPGDAVRDCLKRIVADDRHQGVVTISDRIISEREFPNWEMSAKFVANKNRDALKEQIAGAMVNASAETRNMFEGFSSLVAL